MRIDFHGRLVDEPVVKAGFIGCGSHSSRNVYPALQFAPVQLVAVCDLDHTKADAFAAKYGARQAYSNHLDMLEQEDLDAVFIVTGYDPCGRPLYPPLAVDCLQAGAHVWIEKPPAASCGEIEAMHREAQAAGRQVLVGMKKMFFPANEKAKELMDAAEFGAPSVVLLRYPQYIPTSDEFREYLDGKIRNRTVSFLDHLCHPVSLLIYLLGMPETLYYVRSPNGSGVASFAFASGAVASLALTHGAASNGGMEHTVVVGDGRHITVENNVTVTYHRTPPLGYGNSPSFYTGDTESTSAVWEPEFSLGQLYNKGLFLLGYYNEVTEFARAVLEKRKIRKGGLEDAWRVTRVFEAFVRGPGQVIPIDDCPAWMVAATD